MFNSLRSLKTNKPLDIGKCMIVFARPSSLCGHNHHSTDPLALPVSGLLHLLKYNKVVKSKRWRQKKILQKNPSDFN